MPLVVSDQTELSDLVVAEFGDLFSPPNCFLLRRNEKCKEGIKSETQNAERKREGGTTGEWRQKRRAREGMVSNSPLCSQPSQALLFATQVSPNPSSDAKNRTQSVGISVSRRRAVHSSSASLLRDLV